MRSALFVVFLALFAALAVSVQALEITEITHSGHLTWSNTTGSTTCHVQWASSPTGTWYSGWDGLVNIMTTGTYQTVEIPLFFRVYDTEIPGLIGYYPFNGNAQDESTNSNDGVNNGAVLNTNRFGVADKAYHFDGSSYITMGTVNFTSPVTVTVWFKSTSVNPFSRGIFSWVRNGSESEGLNIATHASDGRVAAFAGHHISTLVTSTNYPDGDGLWHFAALTRDSSDTVKFYVDDTIQGLLTATNSIGTNHVLYVGKTFADEYFTGWIDDIRIYNRALDSLELRILRTLSSE